ncbi:MAG: tRNA threonylcarbamoyladenosine dehydratase [Tissierellia bacterium]|nr:tRNA threonylcarbamoyladenosine dehydratase [Tissierellia bacterium]
MSQFNRTEKLVGSSSFKAIQSSKVSIVGVGGVGSYAAEAIVRAGISNVQIWDGDVVDISNINRQLVALHSTIGEKKVKVLTNRYLDINPSINLESLDINFGATSKQNLVDFNPDFVIDCIDSIKDKIELIDLCTVLNIPIISVMGAGNKFDPGRFKVVDIKKTHTDPLARIIRREASARKWGKLPVISSDEIPVKGTGEPVGSISFVPSVAGLMAAGYVINNIITRKGDSHGTDWSGN